MMLWMTLIETIFQKKGVARQLRLETWITGTVPPWNWRDKYKDNQQISQNPVGRVLGGRFLDPR